MSSGEQVPRKSNKTGLIVNVDARAAVPQFEIPVNLMLWARCAIPNPTCVATDRQAKARPRRLTSTR